MRWEDPMTYPCTKGLHHIKNVTFANFQQDCSGKDYNVVWQTNKWYMDIFHPVLIEEAQMVNVDNEAKV